MVAAMKPRLMIPTIAARVGVGWAHSQRRPSLISWGIVDRGRWQRTFWGQGSDGPEDVRGEKGASIDDGRSCRGNGEECAAQWWTDEVVGDQSGVLQAGVGRVESVL